LANDPHPKKHNHTTPASSVMIVTGTPAFKYSKNENNHHYWKYERPKTNIQMKLINLM
jgi:hypothetical protein